MLCILPAHRATALRAGSRRLPILNQDFYLMAATLALEPSVICHSAHLLSCLASSSRIHDSSSSARRAPNLSVALAVIAFLASDFAVSAATRAIDQPAAAAAVTSVYHVVSSFVVILVTGVLQAKCFCRLSVPPFHFRSVDRAVAVVVPPAILVVNIGRFA